MTSPNAECVSTWGDNPTPAKYSFTVSWSNACELRVGMEREKAVGLPANARSPPSFVTGARNFWEDPRSSCGPNTRSHPSRAGSRRKGGLPQRTGWREGRAAAPPLSPNAWSGKMEAWASVAGGISAGARQPHPCPRAVTGPPAQALRASMPWCQSPEGPRLLPPPPTPAEPPHRILKPHAVVLHASPGQTLPRLAVDELQERRFLLLRHKAGDQGQARDSSVQSRHASRRRLQGRCLRRAGEAVAHLGLGPATVCGAPPSQPHPAHTPSHPAVPCEAPWSRRTWR